MTGTVTFESNGVQIGALVPLGSNGVAILTTSSLTSQGTDTITAIYNGDSNFSGSTSTSLLQTVNLMATSTTVTSSAADVVYNHSGVTLTATVSPGAGVTSGTVTFLENSTSLGTAAVATGLATLALSATGLPVGTDAITAIYSGMIAYAGSTSGAYPQVVDPPTLYWTGTASANWTDANWQGFSGETGLTPITGDSLVFPSTGANQTTNDNVPSTVTFSSITFQAAGYSVGNTTNILSLSGGITSNYNVTISTGVALTANQTWSGTGTLTVSTSLTANATGATIATPIALGAAQTWTAATGDVLTVSGNISGGYGLTVNGAGTLTLTGCNTYTGTTTILAGTLLVGNAAPSGAAGALGTATLAVILGDTSGSANASLLINGAYTVGRLITVQAGSTGTLTIGSTSTTASAVFSGNISLNANVTIAQAVPRATSASPAISPMPLTLIH